MAFAEETGHTIAPHDGRLVDLSVDADRARELRLRAADWTEWTLTPRQLCDLELLMNGAFSPLTGFVRQGDYESVCASMRLADGTLWPIPVTLTVRASDAVDAHLLIHPLIGVTKPRDVDHYTRVRWYEQMLATYAPGRATLALLPLAMRMAGPRESLWHAIIRKNFGCTHFIVGRDHAGPGVAPDGGPFYGPCAAQRLLQSHERELGIEMVPFREMVYVPDLDRYVPDDEVPTGATVLRISGTQVRGGLSAGEPIPEWFTIPAIAAELRRTYRPRHQQGCAVFFTGLPAAGKSTIAQALEVKLLERGSRTVSLLDGDAVRAQLSPELGFSKQDRDLNIRRIGFLAAEIVKHGGIALCAAIAPYEETRRAVRDRVEREGGFVLVHVSTLLEICEERDPKGLYARARANAIANFTGISDPYETPTAPEVVVDGSTLSPNAAASRVLEYLMSAGFLEAE